MRDWQNVEITKFLKSYKLRLCSLTFWYMD